MDLATRVRLTIYERFVEEERPPTAAEVAEALGVSTDEAEDTFRRLESTRVMELAPGTTNIWMAHPLSAVPTSFRVETPRGTYWGNCSWDALGTVAMLGGTGTVETFCPDCREPMRIRVEDGGLAEADGVAHFLVPAARWYENVGFT